MTTMGPSGKPMPIRATHFEYQPPSHGRWAAGVFVIMTYELLVHLVLITYELLYHLVIIAYELLYHLVIIAQELL